MAGTVRPHAASRLNRTGESTDRSVDSRVQSRPERLAQLGFEDLALPPFGKAFLKWIAVERAARRPGW
jgi:hypothetical protein